MPRVGDIPHPGDIRMKSTPKGWPRISSAVFYEEPRKAIDFLCAAFGFELKVLVEGEGGLVLHSQLIYGEGMIMVGGAGPAAKSGRERCISPKSAGGGNTQGMMVFVDDAEAHCAQARAAGAVITQEPEIHDHGEDYWADKSYGALDPEGHHWWFCERVREQKG